MCAQSGHDHIVVVSVRRYLLTFIRQFVSVYGLYVGM